MLFYALHALAFIAGVVLVIITLSAAIRSFVLPRNEVVKLNTYVFRPLRTLFDFASSRHKTFSGRDRVQAHYAPVALVALPVVWLAVVALGFTGIYWGMNEGDWLDCFQLSGSSLLTLGTHKTRGPIVTAFTFAEATLGLLLLTLLISYLPTIYQAFSRRELVVSRVELRAGAPPTASTLLLWLYRRDVQAPDTAQWEAWEGWFMELEESHTSLPILSFFRSPQPGRSWVTTASLILDSAALMFSSLEGPHNQQAELTFKAGCVSINRIFRFFNEDIHTKPSELLPDNEPLENPHRAEFDEAYARLAEGGLPLRRNRDEAWQHYHELRSRYTTALEFLGRITMAPEVKDL
ncbi:hypothetical protein [Hymenobacter canadensis]|uniref:Two pore domain potassium channel family protein n=1 Tax=Hymenobacter canadensis TaxID=2999067 RepID=A0ABY7LNR3_9BACT|nr:hypothetical protein [Hymenobacter canadensis]WBA41489.1 hypothetical protein O3303_16940 [Hymenobacter canadensis]